MEVDLTCEVCANNPHKYKCPRCNLKTCSLNCCLEHKQKFDCSGVAESVTFCQKHEYGSFEFQKDYHLLEEIDRRNACRERQLNLFKKKNRSLLRSRKQLLDLATNNGIVLRLAPSPFLFDRSRVNHSHVIKTDQNGLNHIIWSVEFGLLHPNYNHEKRKNLARSNPLRLVIHNCDEDSRLTTLWNERLLQLSSAEQDSLVTYKPSGSPPFGVVSSWLYGRRSVIGCNNPRYYYYVQLDFVDPLIGKGRQYLPLEVFPSNKLSQILITPRLLVHELPTIWVSHSELIQ